MKRKILKVLRITGKVLLILFIVLSAVPYLIPVNQQKVDETAPPFAESRFAKINGKRWHYRVFEPKDSSKGNIVLIHGFSGSTFSWRHNQQVLADSGYRVVSIDLPSFGFSEKENNAFDHSAKAHAESIWYLLDSIRAPSEKWTLVGHSMGAGVVWAMAGLQTEDSRTIFMIDGAGQMGQPSKNTLGGRILKLCLRYPPLLRWADVLGGIYFFKQKKYENLLTSAYSQQADSVAAAGYLQPFLIKNSASAIVEMVIHSKEYAPLDYTKLQAPVHLIWGTKDNWVPIETGEAFVRKIQQAAMIKIEGAGHCPMETHPEEFNKALLKRISISPK